MNSLSGFFSRGGHLDDWFSPILVKELRQGMRARAFVLSFLLLQVFLVVLVLGNVAARDDRSTLDFQNRFFWTIIGFVLLVLMPLRGLVTVAQEIRNHTLETILLTRLTAWRVVLGKWNALFAQSLLLVSAVLPYVVLRYFIGGEDVVSDFEWIFFLLWLSGILIAASIAVSALNNVVFRIIILVGIVVLTVIGTGNLFSFGFVRSDTWETIGWLLIFGFFVPALLFELTASSIAPVCENHAIRRRLLALLFYAAACVLYGSTRSNFDLGVAVPLIVLIGICYFELAEKPRLLPRMVHSLACRGRLGKIAAIFLLPGWPSALPFSLVVIPSAITLYFQMAPPGPDSAQILLIFAVLGSILPPVLICHLFWPKMNQVLLMVILYNSVLLAFASLLEGFATLARHSIYLQIGKVFAFLPSLPVLYVGTSADVESYRFLAFWYLAGNGIVLSLVVLLLLMGSRKYYREKFALFRSVGSSPNSRKTAPVSL